LLYRSFFVIGFCAAFDVAGAQCTTRDSAAAVRRGVLATVGTSVHDSVRLGTLTGACWGNASLIRSSFTLDERGDLAGGVTVLRPVLTTAYNSKIPDSRNDGALWAGRGWNLAAIGGARLSAARVRVVLAPQLVWSENRQFPVLPNRTFPLRVVKDPALSEFASPFHSGNMSADLPLRFGTEAYGRLDPGESYVDIRFGPVATGATSAPLWWGPGRRNALVMSNNAPGIPHAFMRTTRPLSTRFGSVEAYWMAGGLQESPFFDFDTRNDTRAVSAAAVTMRFAADSGLTLGGARAVYSFVRRGGAIPLHAADVLFNWSRAKTSGLIANPRNQSDQLFSLFARWVFPEAGFAFHGEWAKAGLPNSVRELLLDPQKRQAYTLGFEWTRLIGRNRILLEAEGTNLEQTPLEYTSDISDFYVSHVVRQGFTNQGQAIGAAIGPGSSSQFLGISMLTGMVNVGVFGERVRWEEGAYARSGAGIAYRTHDVSLAGGLTAQWAGRYGSVDARLTHTYRVNYLFQSANLYLYGHAFNQENRGLVLRLAPRW
jgi:hypothetical protein